MLKPGREAAQIWARSNNVRHSCQVSRCSSWSAPITNAIDASGPARRAPRAACRWCSSPSRRRISCSSITTGTGCRSKASRSMATRSAADAFSGSFCHGLPAGMMRSSSGTQQPGEVARPARRGRCGPGRSCRPAERRRQRRLTRSPVPVHQEIGVQRRLRGAGCRMPVVAPFHHRRQRHQDRFGAPARLQAEQRAAVEHQVELDIAAAPVRLEVALALAVGHVLAALQDRQVGRRGNGRRRSASSRSCASKSGSLKSSKKMPPTPRGSLRCFR